MFGKLPALSVGQLKVPPLKGFVPLIPELAVALELGVGFQVVGLDFSIFSNVGLLNSVAGLPLLGVLLFCPP